MRSRCSGACSRRRLGRRRSCRGWACRRRACRGRGSSLGRTPEWRRSFCLGGSLFRGRPWVWRGGQGYGGAARGYGYESVYAGHLGGSRDAGGGSHGYSAGAYWGGGYWRGGWWPRAYYGAGFAWFLPVLPLAYATYWYAGIPYYYYANDLYYTWSPDYNGYVATDPPPVGDPSGAAAGPDAPPANAAPSGAYSGAPQPPQDTATASPAPMSSQGDRMFIYPSHGQSAEQQRTDKLECENWASDEVGLGSNGPDYQRAMAACLEGRGYSGN